MHVQNPAGRQTLLQRVLRTRIECYSHVPYREAALPWWDPSTARGISIFLYPWFPQQYDPGNGYVYEEQTKQGFSLSKCVPSKK